MSNKTFWFGFIAIYVIVHILSFILHGMLLGDVYRATANVWRPEGEMKDMMWIMFVTSAIYLFLFCYIFTKGYEGKGIGEGVRYGLLMGLFMSVPMAFESYVIYPVTLNLAITWFIGGVVTFVIAGAVFAAIYKPQAG